MRWRHKSEKRESAQDRLDAAERAGTEGEALRDKVNSQVSFLHSLRQRWSEVHEENHLSELFREEWRRT